LTVVGGKMTHHPGVAWPKRNVIRKNWTRDKVERGAWRLRTLRKRLWTRQEDRMGVKDLFSRRPLYLRKERRTAEGIRGWSTRQQAHLGRGGTLYKTLYEIVSVRIVKRCITKNQGLGIV
jgi:hypothetical protein